MHYITSPNTQSSAPEDGQNNCAKHVELTGIINKPLLLHLVGCLYYLYFIIFLGDLLNDLNLFLSECRVFHNVTFLVRKIFTLYINDVLLFKCPFQGQRVKHTASQLVKSLVTCSYLNNVQLVCQMPY